MPPKTSITCAYDHSEEGGFKQLHISDALGKRQFMTTRSVLEAASACRMTFKDQGHGIVVLFHSSEWKVRRGAAIFVFFRISLDQSNRCRTSSAGFRTELLDESLSKVIVVPDRYSLRELRESFFAAGDIYNKSKELGVLLDFTMLDTQRTITLLSVKTEQRNLMVNWIRAVADATVPAPPPPAPRHLSPAMHTRPASASPHSPAVAHSPSLGARLAQRTVDQLVEVGFDPAKARLVVEGLADKGDVEAAMNRMLDDSYAHVAGPAGAPEGHNSDASSLSDATTNLDLRTPAPSPDRSEAKSVWPSLGRSGTNGSAVGSVPDSGRASPDYASERDSAAKCDEPKACDNSECAVCLSAEACHAFLPCGHMAACGECAEAVHKQQGYCPMCRVRTTGHLRIYTHVN